MVEQNEKRDREEEFVRIGSLLHALAEASGGQYDSFPGIDPKEIEAIKSPLMNMLMTVGSGMFGDHSSEGETLKEFEKHYSNCVVDWHYRHHKVRLLVRKIGSSAESGGVQTAPFELQIRVVVQPNRVLSLMIFERKPFSRGSPTGSSRSLSLPSYFRNFTAKGMVRMFDAAPSTTYYCPFGSVELERKYRVRSCPVFLGQAFVRDSDIVGALLTAPDLQCLLVGPHDWQYGGTDNVVRLEALVPDSLEELQTFLNIVFRSLDVLGQLKLID